MKKMKNKKPNTKRFQTIKNGCGGKNSGTKCGVEVYIMPYMKLKAV
jgi:hypothetical protein